MISLLGFFLRLAKRNKAETIQTGRTRPLKNTNVVDLTIHDVDRISRCNVCFDEHVKGVDLACEHQYCLDCTRNLFHTALQDSSLLPLQCCELPIDTSIANVILRKREVKMLRLRIMESEAKRKMYCPKCNAFINLDMIDELTKEILCDCGTELCGKCATIAHPYVTCLANQTIKTEIDKELFNIAGKKRMETVSSMWEYD